MNGSEMVAGSWWRFSDYEVRDSYIRPAPSARLERYDPWSEWEETRPLGQGSLSAYGELLGVIAALQRDPGFAIIAQSLSIPVELQSWRNQPAIRLKEKSTEKLIAWCRQFGLLGLLPHRARQITLCARLSALSGEERDQILSYGAPPDVKIPASVPWQTKYTRTVRGWLLSGGLPESSQNGSVLLESWDGQSVTIGSLREIAAFFPSITDPALGNEWERFEYPVPLSVEFWQTYAEPISEFVRSAIILRDAIDAMSMKRAARSNRDRRRLAQLNLLDGLLSPVGMTSRLIPGTGVRARLAAGSLLSTLAAMALQDAPKGQVRRCDQCGAVFISGAHPWTRYCSKRCRSTAQQRTYRKRKRPTEK